MATKLIRIKLKDKKASISVREHLHIIFLPLIVQQLIVPDRKAFHSKISKGEKELRQTRIQSSVLSSHVQFKRLLVPELPAEEDFEQKCAAEVNAVCLFFPEMESDALKICFASWLALVCLVDDMIEDIPPRQADCAVMNSVHLLQHSGNRIFDSLCPSPPYAHRVIINFAGTQLASDKAGNSRDTTIPRMTQVFIDHCSRHLSNSSLDVFFQAVCNVFQSFLDEKSFLQSGSYDLQVYMSIRSRTIAIRPFFEAIKNEYIHEDRRLCPAWEKLEHLQFEVDRAVGLQNDLVGLERDLKAKESMNAVVAAIRSSGGDVGNVEEELLNKCISQVSTIHNGHVTRALELYSQIDLACKPILSHPSRETARLILMMSETHLQWCVSSKRYSVET